MPNLPRRTLLAAAAAPMLPRAAVAAAPLRIGILNDQSGPYADLGGPGSVVAARMAAEDAGGAVDGRPIEVLAADHQNKAEIGAAIAREWFDREDVQVAVGFDNSAVALAVERLAAERNRIAIATAVGTGDFTGRACGPLEAAWLYDSYALTTSLVRTMVAAGQTSWYFLTVDYAFGHALEEDARRAVAAAGGSVAGSARHPLGTADFSAYLLQAQTSGAQVIAFANGGADFINAMKQAREFGLRQSGHTLAALLLYITDVHSLGLEITQGLRFLTAFYWDSDEATRAWSRRFAARTGRVPTMNHAAIYSAVRHFLRAAAAPGPAGAAAVMARMRAMPVEDFYVHDGRIRADGRLMHDMYLMRVKRPDESAGPWDYYRREAIIPAAQAFRPLAEGACTSAKGGA